MRFLVQFVSLEPLSICQKVKIKIGIGMLYQLKPGYTSEKLIQNISKYSNTRMIAAGTASNYCIDIILYNIHIDYILLFSDLSVQSVSTFHTEAAESWYNIFDHCTEENRLEIIMLAIEKKALEDFQEMMSALSFGFRV